MAPGWRFAAFAVIFALAASPRRGGVEAATRRSDEERRVEYERFVDKMMDAMPADELAEELVEVIHRTMDSERRERRKKELQRDFDTDDEALLERIGRLVVEWINTRLTPRTDEECRWVWGRWRCDPQCSCRYKYRFGDYTPGRSCRLRPEDERGLSTCDPEAGNDVSLLEKLASFVVKVLRRTWRFTTEHVVPQTDSDCRFSLARSLEEKRPVCSPRKSCAFRYKFGDVHPGRSCRRRQPGNEYSKGMVRTGGRDKGSGGGTRGGSSGASKSGGEGERAEAGWSMFEGGGSSKKRYDDDDDDEEDEDEDDYSGRLFMYDD